MAGKVFICYRRDDSAGHAGRVHDRLQREFGDDLLFMDVDGIPLGANFVKVLGEEVAKCDALLAMIGPAWLDARDDTGKRRLDNPDDFVRIEIGTALERGVPVIPILFEGTRIPKADQLPDKLRELALRNGLDVRHASFPQDMERLIRALKGIQSPQGLASTIPPLVHRDAPSRKVWTFLGDDKKRAVLGWIGGGVAAVVGALWAAFVYLAPPSKPGTPPASIEAGPGDVAIGDNVSGTKRLASAGGALDQQARRRNGTAGGGGCGLSRDADGIDARARAARLGHDPEQSRRCVIEARRARERHGAAGGGGRGLSRGAEGKDARALAAGLGHDPDQSRPRPHAPGHAPIKGCSMSITNLSGSGDVHGIWLDPRPLFHQPYIRG
jgi:TIR domain